MSKIDDIRKHYVSRITPGRPNHDVLDWAGPDTQTARFEILARYVNLTGRSLLDVGCGLGDLVDFLRRKKIPVQYTGVDVVEEMLVRARREHPRERFLRADLFTNSAGGDPLKGETFDVVFCSGALNLNLGNNLEFLPRALRRLLIPAREALADPVYFYYRPDDVLAVLQPLVGESRVQMIDGYLPNDFTILCRFGEG
jgi:SAM-dependent methyltransferase